MTVENMVEVVRGLDQWHVECDLGNLRLKTPEGVVSMISGWLNRLPDEALRETLTLTFCIDPAQITCAEDLFADEADVTHSNEQWGKDKFEGSDD